MEFFAVFLTHMSNSEEVIIVESPSKHTIHDQVVASLDSGEQLLELNYGAQVTPWLRPALPARRASAPGAGER